MSYWRIRVVGAVLCIFLYSPTCIAGSMPEARFHPDDRVRIPELVFIDSLLTNYQYGQADDTLRGLLRNYHEADSSGAEVAALLYGRLGFAAAGDGHYDSALACYRRAEDLIAKQFGTDSHQYAEVLLDRGDVEATLRHDSASVELFESAIRINERRYSKISPYLIEPLHQLCQAMILLYEVDSSKALLDRAYNIISQSDTGALYHLFNHHYYLGDYFFMNEDYDSADAHFAAASDIAENHLGKLQQAECYQDWAYTYDSRQMIEPADSLSSMALALVEESLRSDHPELATALIARASVLLSTNDNSLALKYLNQAEQIIANSLGEAHPAYVSLLRTKANLFMDMRDYTKAIEYNRRQQEFARITFGENSSQYISSIGTLSVIYLTLFEYESAIPLLVEYRDYYLRHDGVKSLSYLNAFGYLAYANYLSGAYQTAESLYTDIIPVVEDVFGPNSRKTGELNLYRGMASYALGNYDLAEQSYLRALSVYEKIMVAYNPEISGVYSFLATLYGSTGDFEKSLSYYQKLLKNRYTFLSAAYSYASADQKLRYLAVHPVLMHSLFSMAMKANNEKAKRFSFEMLLRGKGLALDVLASENRLARCTDDPGTRTLYEALQKKSDEIANLTYSLQGEEEIRNNKPALASLFIAKQELESELSSRCEVSAREILGRTLTLDSLLPHVPDNAVLLEFAEYDPYDFDRADATHRLFGESHYLVYILDNKGRLELTDIGTKAAIDSLIAQSRMMTEQVPSDIYGASGKELERQFVELSSKLFSHLIEPYYDRIAAAETWLISGDGGLNVLPFESLIMPTGEYVVEKHTLSYLASSRDLFLYDKESEGMPESMTLYFDPDYDAKPSGPIAQNISASTANDNHASSISDPFPRGDSGCFDGPFLRLANTKQEAAGILSAVSETLIKGVWEYSGGLATESSIKRQIHHADMYHFATHGFVCPDLKLQDYTYYQSLMLYSGIALAGANTIMDSLEAQSPAGDDGILTAFEISGLDFEGVDLVTLSACETGLGETIAGEGVFGLRRAFQLAGAKSLVMSLRKIPDTQGAELMSDFYRRWLIEKNNKAQALRQATVHVLEESRAKNGNGHPFFWGGFILFGKPN